ncbi:hypothetical protein, partial [Desulfobacter curvatus]|uniref:hypothetical protein n=1 Tax=Desulfobacter curvatus TaxID=2290 RepID=UPI001B7FAEA6
MEIFLAGQNLLSKKRALRVIGFTDVGFNLLILFGGIDRLIQNLAGPVKYHYVASWPNQLNLKAFSIRCLANQYCIEIQH